MKYKFKTNYVYQYFTDDKGSQGRITYTKGDIVDGKLNRISGNIQVSVTPFKAYDVVNKKYTTLNSIDVRGSFLETEMFEAPKHEPTNAVKMYKVIKEITPTKYRLDGGSVSRETLIFNVGDEVYGVPAIPAANMKVAPEFYTQNITISISGDFSSNKALYYTSKDNLKEIIITSGQGIDETGNNLKNTKKYKITKDYDARHIFTDNLIHSTVVRPPKRFYKGDIVDAKIYQGKIVSGNYDITEVAELYDDKNVELQSEKEKGKLFTTNNILIGLAVIAVIGIGYYIIKK